MDRKIRELVDEVRELSRDVARLVAWATLAKVEGGAGPTSPPARPCGTEDGDAPSH